MNKFFLPLACIATLLLSCNDTPTKVSEDNKIKIESKSQTYKENGTEFCSFYTLYNGHKEGPYFIFYKKSGLLFQGGVVHNDTLIGYHCFYDTTGRLYKKTRYEKDGFDKSDVMVESIIYDSTGNVDFNKSYFTSIFPEGDTINVFSRKNLKLNFSLHYSSFDEARIYIYKIMGKQNLLQDSILTKTSKADYQIRSLSKGVNDFMFLIKLRHYSPDGKYLDHESKTYRRIKVWSEV